MFDRVDKKLIKIYVSNANEFATFSQIFLRQDYDTSKLQNNRPMQKYEELLNSNQLPLIVDLGGNVGYASIYLRLVYPESRIILLEPSEKNYDLAIRNLEKYDVTSLNSAIGPHNGHVNILDPGLGDNGLRCEIREFGEIKMLTVNDILYNNSDSTPFIVKIDIEGFERELFSGDNSWISEFPILIIELHDFLFPLQSNSSNFLRAISQLDRDFVYIGENVFSVKN